MPHDLVESLGASLAKKKYSGDNNRTTGFTISPISQNKSDHNYCYPQITKEPTDLVCRQIKPIYDIVIIFFPEYELNVQRTY